MKKHIYSWIFSRVLGWRIVGSFNPEIRKSVLMVMPHTSWHDFYIGLLTRVIIGLEMHYVAKKELFRFPFGWFFRYMGGAPIDRSKNQNRVDVIANVFKQREVFRLAIAPEGTRRKVDSLKSGFYYIAHKASVPIIPVAFDYETRTVKIFREFYPTGDYEADLLQLLPHYIGVAGKISQNGFDAFEYLNKIR